MGDNKLTEHFKEYLIFVDPQNTKYSGANIEKWNQGIFQLLQKIESSKVGYILLENIKVNGKKLHISARDDCGANTSTSTETGDIFIDFALDSMNPSHPCEAKYNTFGQYRQEPDETLAHEMVHAIRQGSGAWKSKAELGSGLAMYDDTEEFNAVLIQGIYASEHKTPIRGSHYRHYVIDKELADSFNFFQNGTQTFLFVLKFCLESPGLTRRISLLNLPFNPLRAYYLDPKKAQKLSQSELAKRRDGLVPMVHTILHQNENLIQKLPSYGGKIPDGFQ